MNWKNQKYFSLTSSLSMVKQSSMKSGPYLGLSAARSSSRKPTQCAACSAGAGAPGSTGEIAVHRDDEEEEDDSLPVATAAAVPSIVALSAGPPQTRMARTGLGMLMVLPVLGCTVCHCACSARGEPKMAASYMWHNAWPRRTSGKKAAAQPSKAVIMFLHQKENLEALYDSRDSVPRQDTSQWSGSAAAASSLNVYSTS